LIRIAGFQGDCNIVAFGLSLESFLLATFQLGFEIVTLCSSFESNDKTVSIATVRIGLDALFE